MPDRTLDDDAADGLALAHDRNNNMLPVPVDIRIALRAGHRAGVGNQEILGTISVQELLVPVARRFGRRRSRDRPVLRGMQRQRSGDDKCRGEQKIYLEQLVFSTCALIEEVRLFCPGIFQSEIRGPALQRPG